MPPSLGSVNCVGDWMCSPGVLRIAIVTELALEGGKKKKLLLFSSNFFYQFSKEVSKTKTTRPRDVSCEIDGNVF